MIKLNMKLKSNNPQKVKVPKIEINECKGKTKDHKKLEKEMFEQQREAKRILEQLLNSNDRFDEFGRPRSNSLNATVETLILSTNFEKLPKNLSKSRGSVPIISTFPKKLLTRNKETSNSLPTSPNTSTTQRSKNPLKFMRKHADHIEKNGISSECWSPKSKRAMESSSVEELSNVECISFKDMSIQEIKTATKLQATAD